MDASVVNFYPRPPFSSVAREVDARCSRGIALPRSGVSIVLLLCRFSKIDHPIIVTYAVDVVDLIPRPLAVSDEPREAMREILTTVEDDLDVPACPWTAGHGTDSN